MSSKANLPISVAMTTYNGGQFLERQIESILSQSLSPAEILVCDDQSTDNTVEILNKYMRKGKLLYTVNEERLGLVENFKKVVSLTKGNNYIALSDQDDIWLENKLETCAKELLKIESVNIPSMVYSDLLVVDEDDKVVVTSFWNETRRGNYTHCIETLIFGNFVNGCTTLFNPPMRSYFSTIPNNVPLNHDAWLALIAFTFGKVSTIKEPLVKYRQHRNNITFSTSYEKLGKLSFLLQSIKNIINNNWEFLRQELHLAEMFKNYFKGQLTLEQLQTFESFLKLKNVSYLKRRVGLRKSFEKKWIK